MSWGPDVWRGGWGACSTPWVSSPNPSPPWLGDGPTTGTWGRAANPCPLGQPGQHRAGSVPVPIALSHHPRPTVHAAALQPSLGIPFISLRTLSPAFPSSSPAGWTAGNVESRRRGLCCMLGAWEAVLQLPGSHSTPSVLPSTAQHCHRAMPGWCRMTPG